MKILKKGKMPDGTKIQIEDWKEDYSFMNVCVIGTYPIAVNTSKNSLIRAGDTFRLELSRFKSNKEVEDIFTKLENGKLELKDLSDNFNLGHTDKFYLGLVKTEEMIDENTLKQNIKLYINSDYHRQEDFTDLEMTEETRDEINNLVEKELDVLTVDELNNMLNELKSAETIDLTKYSSLALNRLNENKKLEDEEEEDEL